MRTIVVKMWSARVAGRDVYEDTVVVPVAGTGDLLAVVRRPKSKFWCSVHVPTGLALNRCHSKRQDAVSACKAFHAIASVECPDDYKSADPKWLNSLSHDLARRLRAAVYAFV